MCKHVQACASMCKHVQACASMCACVCEYTYKHVCVHMFVDMASLSANRWCVVVGVGVGGRRWG